MAIHSPHWSEVRRPAAWRDDLAFLAAAIVLCLAASGLLNSIAAIAGRLFP